MKSSTVCCQKGSQFAQRLTSEHWVLAASPSYIKQHGVAKVSDIAKAEKALYYRV
ncbi:hypothetical protein QW180_26935 [Vibrio sinaloensis]|nr:hypothetical protein [Vibrio sinaloensis]